ncbi:STAS-like domain-containing protein [Candidatus Uhrbacteria bacterium]|nr:STAS-like domain-containing protein [Candidatus Uhrbacteria bacterium]
MTNIKLFISTGAFAENKDEARDIRMDQITPAIKKGDDVVLDFEGIDGATQSFVHALISDVIRKEGFQVIEKLHFKNCNPTVQKIITIVTEYMQESY